MHLIPVTTGFLVQVFSVTFIVFAESANLYYLLTTMTSGMLYFFFGWQNFYSSYDRTNSMAREIGFKIIDDEKVGARLFTYYPAHIDNPKKYKNTKLIDNPTAFLRGVKRFSFGYLPQFMFKFLTNQN